MLGNDVYTNVYDLIVHLLINKIIDEKLLS